MENEPQAESKLNKNRIALWLVVLVLAIAGLFAMNRQKETEAITLGAILPLTGSGADQAEWIKRGFDLALDEVNKNTKTPIVIAYEDSAGDTQKALSAYNKLRAQFQIPVVFTWGSGIGIALTPIVNKDRVVQMGVATAADAYSTPDDFTFRNFPRAEQEAAFLSNAISRALQSKEAAILKINNDYGKGSANSFKAQFIKDGGRVIAEETFAPNDSDFRAQLTKLKALSPRVIYLATYPKEGGLVLREAKELGVTSRFIASVAILGGKDFFTTAGKSAEGLIVVTSAPLFLASSDSVEVDFTQKYYSRYNELPGAQQLYTARAYDALKILALAIDTCKADTTCIQKALYKVQNYHGVSGTLSFDRNGDISADFNLQTVRNGQFTVYQE